jgi:hypothetical protein
MYPMVVTELTSQLERSALNAEAWLNMLFIFVTELTSQSFISADPAGPQSAVAQHVTPVASTAKQLSTAVLSAVRLVNGAASAPTINPPMRKKGHAPIKLGELEGDLI